MANEQIERFLADLARKQEPVADDRVAGLLGLRALQVGSKKVATARDADNWRVLAWWMVVVEPSFDPYFAVGAVHEELHTGGPGIGRVAIRGFVAGEPGADVAALDADPIPDALGRLNPFRVEPPHRIPWDLEGQESWGEVATADGLGYLVRWGTKAVDEGAFRFANPGAGWPLEFERLVYQFARRVTLTGGVGDFEDALVRWRGYRDGIDTAEPIRPSDRGGRM